MTPNDLEQFSNSTDIPALIEQLNAIEKKVEAINCNSCIGAQAEIRLDLINQYQKEFNTTYPALTSHFSDKATTLSATLSDLLAKQELLELNQQNNPSSPEDYKLQKAQLKDQIKIYKQEISAAKKTLSTHKQVYSGIGKDISAKQRNLQALVKKASLQNKQDADRKAKIHEQRHEIEYLRFPALSEQHSASQHKFIISMPKFRVMNVDEQLAAELTSAIHLDSVTAMLEEIGYLLDTHPNRVLMIYKSGLKFNYDLDVNENLRSFHASYQKRNKSWSLSPRELDYHTTQHLNSYIESRFNIIIDLDNKILYGLKDLNLDDILSTRRSHPKARLLSIRERISKADLMHMLSPFYPEDQNNPFNEDRGISFYNPVSKQFEALKKNSIISTKLPELLFRFSVNGQHQFMMVNIQMQEIAKALHSADPRCVIADYRRQLINITQDDFAPEVE